MARLARRRANEGIVMSRILLYEGRSSTHVLARRDVTVKVETDALRTFAQLRGYCTGKEWESNNDKVVFLILVVMSR